MTTDLLYSEEEMNADFNAFANLKIQKEMREVHEGEFHFGKAAVIQVIGIK